MQYILASRAGRSSVRVSEELANSLRVRRDRDASALILGLQRTSLLYTSCAIHGRCIYSFHPSLFGELRHLFHRFSRDLFSPDCTRRTLAKFYYSYIHMRTVISMQPAWLSFTVPPFRTFSANRESFYLFKVHQLRCISASLIPSLLSQPI